MCTFLNLVKIMVHFGSLVESQEKFKCIEIMTQESFDFQPPWVRGKVDGPNDKK